MKGREPNGIVEQGVEYDNLLAHLEQEFLALMRTDTGEKVVARIEFPWKECFGPKRDDLPDVSIIWESSSPITSLTSASVGIVEGSIPLSVRPGNHTETGFLLLSGSGFVGSPCSINADMRSIAPTILQMYGVAIPENYEKPALTDLLIKTVNNSS